MKALGIVSAVQLGIHLIQARKSIRERIPYDLPVGRGKPGNVARDMWFMGSGMAAPWPILTAHAIGTGFLLAQPKPKPWLGRAIGWLGVVYVFGYLGERSVRESFRRPNGDATALNAVSTLLAFVMLVLGFRSRRSGI